MSRQVKPKTRDMLRSADIMMKRAGGSSKGFEDLKKQSRLPGLETVVDICETC